jgi:hypothetical protein
MRTTALRLIVWAAAASVLIAATGSKETGSTTETAAGTPAPPAAPTPKPTPVPLTENQMDQLFIPRDVPAERDGMFSLVYSGYRHSVMEPCGCVSHQLGGIDKEARLPARLAQLGFPMAKADAGGFLREAATPNYVVQTKHTMAAVAQMKYDVVNVGFPDVTQGMKYLRDLQSSYSLPFVSANIVDSAGKPLFDPYKLVTLDLKDGQKVRVGFIGITRSRTQVPAQPVAQYKPATPPPSMAAPHGALTPKPVLPARPEKAFPEKLVPAVGDKSATEPQAFLGAEPAKGLGADTPAEPSAEGYEIKDPAEALQKYLPELREKADVIVLLDYENRQSCAGLLQKLGEGTGINVAVAGEYAGVSTGVDEVFGTRLVSAGFEGRQVGHMMIECKDKKPARFFNTLVEVVQTLPVVPEVTAFITAYKAELGASSSIVVGSQPVTAPVRVSYQAAESCKSCHAKEYAQWKTTRHATAINSLIKKNSVDKAECIKCHVTGYKDDNGFTEMSKTSHMANVQCEACHGPAHQHVAEQRRLEIMRNMAKSDEEKAKFVARIKPNVKFDAEFCKKCHDAANDKNFNFDRAIRKVNHRRPAESEEKGETTSGTHGG